MFAGSARGTDKDFRLFSCRCGKGRPAKSMDNPRQRDYNVKNGAMSISDRRGPMENLIFGAFATLDGYR